MAYDEDLARRLRAMLAGTDGVTEQRMFGGLGFMVNGHMAVAANSQGGVMVRSNPKGTDAAAVAQGRPMEMRGRPAHGWLVLDAADVADDEDLQAVVDHGVAFVRTLPAKKRGTDAVGRGSYSDPRDAS